MLYPKEIFVHQSYFRVYSCFLMTDIAYLALRLASSRNLGSLESGRLRFPLIYFNEYAVWDLNDATLRVKLLSLRH